MFPRNLEQNLLQWKKKSRRKPLIIRGVRQVGKTKLVLDFASRQFDNHIYLNLEKSEHERLFDKISPISELLEILQIQFRTTITPGQTLLFIDEIQCSHMAITQLRYFYEDYPQLHVIAAGSLLDVMVEKEGFGFPVGRIETLHMYPATFEEFLIALNENHILSFLNSVDLRSKIPEATHRQILKLFYRYLTIGGMPEALNDYLEYQDIGRTESIYNEILGGFGEDVFKYASHAKAQYLRHILTHAPSYCGTTITYEKFGGSSFRSREMKEAFDTLEKAQIIHRVPASYSVEAPSLKNLKKPPKLLFCDVGFLNTKLGLRSEYLTIDDLNNLYRGSISEQVVGQALTALSSQTRWDLSYWYRDKKGSEAELDFVICHQGNLIPIEVKSGKAGTLKSLFQFMKESQMKHAFRIYSGPLTNQKIDLGDHINFQLISLPFYLLHRLPSLLPHPAQAFRHITN